MGESLVSILIAKKSGWICNPVEVLCYFPKIDFSSSKLNGVSKNPGAAI